MVEFAIRVPGLSDRRSVRTVSAAVSDVAGVREVVVDLDTRTITVRGTGDPDAIRAALAAVGYPASEHLPPNGTTRDEESP